MPAAAAVDEEVQAQLDAIGRADVMVGIPSFNNARTIGHVVRAVGAGLVKYFPGCTAVIVNCDGGSRDGTPGIAGGIELDVGRGLLMSAPDRLPARIVTGYRGIPGKGSAFRAMFAIAERLEARACAFVDADLRSITPEWVQLLVGPVLHEGFDYVCPLYSRHKYDGTITNAIAYPLVRSCFGRRVRQPIGGDFGFSGRLAAHYRRQEVWEGDVARFGVDIWMTTTAVAGDFRVCQAYLGAKIHDAKDPGADLTAMLVQVTGALFAQIRAHADRCLAQEGSEHVPEFGFRYEVGLEPVPVNVRRMVDAFERGLAEFDGIYAWFLHPETRAGLTALAGQPPEAFAMPADLWVRIVYDFVAATQHRRLPVAHVLRTLTPLYLGRTAAWVVQAAPYGAVEVEAELDALAARFEAAKPYLRERWHERT